MGTTRVDVIGGSGFIGTRLCRRLSQVPDVEITVVDKVPSRSFPDRCIVADVRNVSDLRSAISSNGCIVNLAAEHRDDVRPLSLYDEVNVGGARNICHVAREKGARTIVFTSSVAVYGFAPIGTGESGAIAPFNEYGRSKFAAEEVFRAWQLEAPAMRTLVIVRPTVVFGEGNRGNVYGLLRQIALGRFLMVGKGENRKSMAYVENVAAFLQSALAYAPGIYLVNFVDKPDFSMNSLVIRVRECLGRRGLVGPRLPYVVGLSIGKLFDVMALLSGRTFPLSAIRVKKFCSDSVYNTRLDELKFVSPVPLVDALQRTIRHEFIEPNPQSEVFFGE
jgi:GlcNAc-P-P-Und epimerase